MKKIISVFLILTLMFGYSSVCFAADKETVYYVDAENGDDTNSGISESSAWKTLAFASAKPHSAGDKILLKAGSVFEGGFTANGSGTAENPIVFGSYGDTEALGKPIIRSNEDIVLLRLNNVSGWTVENIEFTAPNGKGIYVTASDGGMATDITIKNCTFHDIWYKRCLFNTGAYSPILISSSGTVSRIRNLTVSDCNIYDCAYGINTSGVTRTFNPDIYVSPEESYNSDFLFENLSLNNILYDGIVLCSLRRLIVRNCSLINVSLNDDYCTAPLFSIASDDYVIENCEIAGTQNENDGMVIDFDGWTTNGTYQYIYSHDNYRFIRNCCYDNYTKNANCTVRYCLSVNDNKGENSMANLLFNGAENLAPDERPVSMDGFKFYNNTLINCTQTAINALSNAYIANNIFVGKSPLSSTVYMSKNVGTDGKYTTKFDGVFTNNCMWDMGIPLMAKNNFICNPGFAGDDETDKNSFILSKESKLIGKGIQVEEDMGEHDFYGNALTDMHNIGCYEGAGETAQARQNIFGNFFKHLGTYLATFIGFIVNLSSRYWIF